MEGILLKVLVTLEDHLWRGKDGHVYVQGPAGYSVWSELLEFFDEAVLLARVSDLNGSVADENRAEGPSISVHDLPNYAGPWGYLYSLPKLRTRVQQAVANCDAYILRVPGLISRLAWYEIRRLGKPYALNIVGDPWDALGPGTMTGFLRPLYRRVASRNMKAMCNHADATLYWSRGALQNRYPPRKHSYTAVSPRVILCNGFASADLMTERFRAIEERSSSAGDDMRPLRIGFIGSFAQLYKGPDTLLHALSLCSQRRLRFKAFLVGDGRHREAMESLAQELSIQDSVVFMGHLKFGDPIFDFLDSLDLFVMPSRAEGLGRALVEAMARGCPCVGSQVGGIAELLDFGELVPPGDPVSLADKIMEVTGNPLRMKQMAQRNLEKAKQFSPELLKEVRHNFYSYVRLHSGAAK